MQKNPEMSRAEHRRELLADPQYRQLAVSALNNDERLMRKIAKGRKGFNKDYGLPFNLDYVNTKSLEGYEDKEALMTKYGMTAEQADKYNEDYLVASFTGKGKDDTFLDDLGGVADLGIGAYNYFTGEKLPMTENKSSDPNDRVERLYASDVEKYLGAGLHDLATQDDVDLGLAGRIMDRYNNNRLATDPPMKMDQAIAKAQQYRADAGTKSDAERLAAQTALSTNSQLARGVTGARNQFAAKTQAKAKVLADGITAGATVTAAKTRATAVKTAADLSDTRENNRQYRLDQASRRKSLSSIYTNDNSSTSQIMATESQLESLKGTPGYERLKREYDQGVQKSVLSVLRERTDLPSFWEEHIWGLDNETPGINADVEDLAQQLVLSSNGQKVAFRDASGEGTVGEWVDLTTEIPHATLKWIQKHVGKATDPASSNSPDGVIKFGSGLNKDKQEVLSQASITPEKKAAFRLRQRNAKNRKIDDANYDRLIANHLKTAKENK
jgi:hypothetical protein